MPDDADETRDHGFTPPGTGTHSAPTTPIRVTPRASAYALASVAVAAAAFLLGIAVATATRSIEREEVIARQSVGPSGGTVRFAGGQISVPDGALSEERTIVVSRTRVTAATGTQSYAYGFGPADLTFLAPVELTFRLPRGAGNAVVFVQEDGSVEPLPVRLDPGRGTATATVRDLRFEAGGP